MKKKIIFLILSVVLIFSFTLVSFAVIPDGYTSDTVVNLPSKTTITYYQKKILRLPSKPYDYYWTAQSVTPFKATTSVYMRSSSINFENADYAFTITSSENNPFIELIPQKSYYFEMDVTFTSINSADYDMYFGERFSGVKLVLNWNPYLYSSDIDILNNSYVSYDWYKLTPISDTQVKISFNGFLQVSGDNPEIQSISFVAPMTFREGDTYQLEFSNLHFYSTTSPDYIFVNGEYIQITSDKSAIVQTLEDSIFNNHLNRYFDLYGSFLPSSNNTLFLELGNEILFFRKLWDEKIMNIPYISAFVKFSIGLGLTGLLLGVASVLSKKGDKQ